MHLQLPANTGLKSTQIHISAYVKNSVPAFILKCKGVYAPVILRYRELQESITIMQVESITIMQVIQSQLYKKDL